MVTEERRKFPRLNANVTVRYKILTDMEKHIFSDFESYVNEARSRNVSIDGLCINTVNPVPPHTIIGMELIFPEQKTPIRALGRSIWTKKMEKGGGFYTGVEFVAIKERYFDQMSQLLAEYVVEKYKIKDGKDKRNLISLLSHLFKKGK